ncbi:MAG: hypothetical protein ABIK77_07960, partial [candidate division WOR-3 bacterium]
MGKIKITHKIILGIILFTLIIPNLTYPAKYKAKGWWYLSLTDFYAVLPPNLNPYVRLLSGAIGFGSPISVGMGTALVEGSREWGGILPIYLYWVPYIQFKENFAWPVCYFFLGFSEWTGDINIYLRAGMGIHYSVPIIGFGAEAGIIRYGYYYGYYEERTTYISPFIGITLSLLSIWKGIKVEEIEIHPPSIQILASFSDADGNKILSGSEEGKIQISITNKGNGKAKDCHLEISILEKNYKEIISYQEFLGVGNIQTNESRTVNIPIKAKGELPKGSFTIKITCHYKTEGNEPGSEVSEITINTAPTTGMIKVAFKNLSTEGLPSWIIPTPLEYADYSVEYSQDKVIILNLNTGERKTKNVSSKEEAQNFAKNFFLSWDKEPPRILLSSSGGTVNTENVKLFIRLSDDRKLDEMKIYLNGRLYKTEAFAEATETEREILIPLDMGDNEVKII